VRGVIDEDRLLGLASVAVIASLTWHVVTVIVAAIGLEQSDPVLGARRDPCR